MSDELKREEKNNKLVYILFIIIMVLIGLLSYFVFINKNKKECDKCMVVEEPPKISYQLINYSNFTFKMPIDWEFINDSEEYEITNKNNNIFISFEVLNEGYNSFISDEVQLSFLENVQTSDNIKIVQLKKYNNCYLYEGTYNNYDYLMIAIGNENKTILIKAQFLDKISFNNQKNKVIDFALSGVNQ